MTNHEKHSLCVENVPVQMTVNICPFSFLLMNLMEIFRISIMLEDQLRTEYDEKERFVELYDKMCDHKKYKHSWEVLIVTMFMIYILIAFMSVAIGVYESYHEKQ